MPWSPQAFPNLVVGGFTLMGPRTDRYNCVASAAGDDGRWWWPVPLDQYWPPGVPREETAAAFIAAFESLGYVVCSDGELDAVMEKIALYASSRSAAPTHAARQLPSGRWISKLGIEEDITHELHGVDGPAYGAIGTFMARPRRAPGLPEAETFLGAAGSHHPGHGGDPVVIQHRGWANEPIAPGESKP